MKKVIYIVILVFMFGCASTQAQNYSTHKVKAGETIESIAAQYQVPVSSIYSLNPDARKALKLNSVLIIPKSEAKENTSKPTLQVNSGPKTIEVQDKKELVGFKKHRVRRKETLYSLAKKYKVSQDEIKKHNKFLYANNLRKGDKLQIPIFKVIKKADDTSSTTSTYIVKPSEGKWRIAYQFGITVDELEALNPNMPEVLQPGQSINIPKVETAEVKQIDEKYSYYTVLAKEGFYRLKVKLGVEQSVLESLNPGLETSGLKVGMILKVPYNEKIGIDGSDETSFAETGNLAISNLLDLEMDRNSKRIAIMLPFKLNKINADSVSDAKDLIIKDRVLNISLDFYSGVLMAADSLKKLGLNLKLDVYDTKNMESEVISILENNSFEDTDVVIGPLMSKPFDQVSTLLKSKNIPMVSPLVKKIAFSSNVFQSRPSDAVLMEKIVNHFKADSSSHIIVVADQKNKASSAALKKAFPRASIVSSRLDFKTKKDAYYILDQDLINVLKPGKNIVFLETQNNGFVSNATSIMNSLNADKIEIRLTTTGKNRAFDYEEVLNVHLSNLQFTYASISKMIDEDSKNSFIRNYEKAYKVAPNTYAVRGFDLTMDTVLRLVTSENLYESAKAAPLTAYLENKFAYKKKVFGGYFNTSAYIVQYKDLKIIELKQ